jgi:polysaccharide chain length determinant protein (PEP-CTERM system associated)
MSEAANSGGLPFTPADVVDIVRRRWWSFLWPSVLLCCLASALILRVPSVYLATGTILVEGQQIPDSLVKTTVDGDANERIGIVRRLVMTRENLLGIIRKFDLFPEQRGVLSESQLIGRFRAGIEIETLSRPGSRNNRSIPFRVSYEARSAEEAFNVTQELVRLFLSENFRTRTERASETTDFLSKEADVLKADLDAIESEIAAYKQKHADALPEHLKLHMDMLERTQEGLRDTKLDIKSAMDELRFLEVEKAAVASGMGDEEDALTPAQELARAQTELTRLLGMFSDRHPDVRSQRRLIARLEAQVKQEMGSDGSVSAEDRALLEAADGSIDVARVEAQMRSVRERIETLRQREVELQAKQEELEGIVLRTPEVQRGLAILTRDYENTEDKFKEVTGKEMQARLALSLEEEEQAERFTVIDPPVLPDSPSKPNRKKLFIFAVLAAGIVGAAWVFVLEMLDRKIRSAISLQRIVGAAPLVTIPMVERGAADNSGSRYQRLALGASAGTVVLLLTAIHFMFMPLNSVLARLLGVGE